MERLSLHEGEELDFGADGEEEVNTAHALCLVGRFLTDHKIRVPTMKDRMADIWRPGAWGSDHRSGGGSVPFSVLSSTGYPEGVKKRTLVL